MPTARTVSRSRHPVARNRNLGKILFTARAEPVLLKVPPLQYLMVDGSGDPGKSAEFQEAIQALFSLAYGIRFALKKQGDTRAFSPFHLEGLYWVPGREGSLTEVATPGTTMHWTLMIAVPPFVTRSMVERVRGATAATKPLPALARVRLERFTEGAAAQVLHVGPYDAEGLTIERLFSFIAAAGRTPRGKHHEIYLNDPRIVGPAKTKTILRQPVGASPLRSRDHARRSQ